MDDELRKEIISWREEIWKEDFGYSLFGPAAILSDETVNLLSSFGPIAQLVDLKAAMGGNWAWFDMYGEQLLALFQRLEVAPKKPKPTKARAPRDSNAKRPLSNVSEEQEIKRRRIQSPPTPNPTPVSQCETPRQPTSTPSQSLNVPRNPNPYPYPYHLPQTPLLHNPYAILATPGTSTPAIFTPHSQVSTTYTPMTYTYPYFYPFGTPSSSHQTPIRYPNHYQYPPILAPPPPPPPPST